MGCGAPSGTSKVTGKVTKDTTSATHAIHNVDLFREGIWDSTFNEVEILGNEGRYLNVWGNLFDLRWQSTTHVKGRFRNVKLKNKTGDFEWFFEDESLSSFTGNWKWDDDAGWRSQQWTGRKKCASVAGGAAKPPTCKEALRGAIARGVPLWNKGDYKGCTEIYKAVAEAHASADGRLAKALREGKDAPVGSSKNSLGWILRRAFDTILNDTGDSRALVDDAAVDDQELVQASAAEMEAIQELFDNTLKSKRTRDRCDGKVPTRLVVVQAQKNVNPRMLATYCDACADIQAKRSKDERTGFLSKTMIEGNLLSDSLSRESGEAYLFHGTNPDSIVSIAKHDFRVEVAGSNRGAMFGPGIYLAENCSKADEYAKDGSGVLYKGIFAMLLCRTIHGKACFVESPGDYKDKVTSGEHDCVIGDREHAVGTYREVILFNAKQVFPEYAVLYRRQMDE